MLLSTTQILTPSIDPLTEQRPPRLLAVLTETDLDTPVTVPDVLPAPWSDHQAPLAVDDDMDDDEAYFLGDEDEDDDYDDDMDDDDEFDEFEEEMEEDVDDDAELDDDDF